jgi:hypothetical protein
MRGRNAAALYAAGAALAAQDLPHVVSRKGNLSGIAGACYGRVVHHLGSAVALSARCAVLQIMKWKWHRLDVQYSTATTTALNAGSKAFAPS